MLGLKRYARQQNYSASNLGGGKGSHRIFVRREIREMLNFQEVKGKAKPYQVKQFVKIIEKYNLLGE